MEKMYDIHDIVPSDEIGLGSLFWGDVIKKDLECIITDSDLSNIENKKLFSTLIRANGKLMTFLEEFVLKPLLEEVINECEDENIKRYLTGKYNSIYSQPIFLNEVPCCIREVIEKYLGYDKLTDKYKSYCEQLRAECDRITEKYQIPFGFHEAELEGKGEYWKRRALLNDDFEIITKAVQTPINYFGTSCLLHVCIIKLERYIIDNAYSYIEIERVIGKLINDMNDLPEEKKTSYFITMLNLVKKYYDMRTTKYLEEKSHSDNEVKTITMKNFACN